MAARISPLVAGGIGAIGPGSHQRGGPLSQPYFPSKAGNFLTRQPLTKPLNTDPGVFEPGDHFKPNLSSYPDQEDFLNQLRQQIRATNTIQNDQNGFEDIPMEDEAIVDETEGVKPQVEEAVLKPVEDVPDLPLANDYKGIGGPETVPLFTPEAFQKPDVAPHKPCILDDLYLAPSPEQLKAYQRTLTKFEIAETKSRLKMAISFHLLLMILMVGKLLPDIFDRLDIFVLELEELYLPKPHFWEWIWLMSCFGTYLGISGMRKSSASVMNKFVTLIFLLGMTPILFGMVYYCTELFEYASTGSKENLTEWKGYPIAVLWYVFFLLSMQAHTFELYLAGKLMKTWRPKAKLQ